MVGMMASIRLEHVSVSFPIYSSATRSIKNRLMNTATGGQIRSESGSDRIAVVQSLQDINLALESGDRVGLVGHNGAGKTTLLRVLAKIYEPNEGRVVIEGATVPLFDISLGMDPESTGYENIVLRGLYLGLSRSKIQARLDEIAEFTELGDFLDLPIRTYSAGMQMRLAFAVSTSVAPDILLLDEGIGAGDAAFLEKASERLKHFTEQVSIIVLSSHSEDLIKKMCNKAVLMEHGKLICFGETEDVLDEYRSRRGGSRADRSNTARGESSDADSPARADPLGWAAETARLIRKEQWSQVDIDSLATEVESIAEQDRQVLEGLLTYLIRHLLNWFGSEGTRTDLRREIIAQARRQLELMVVADQHLGASANPVIQRAYRKARILASRDLQVEPAVFPSLCAMTLETLLDPSWRPSANTLLAQH